MAGLILLGRLVLAVVFAVAGAAKLADREGSREGLRGFGLPNRAATPLVLLVPLAELAAAVMLVVPSTARAGAILALALLAAFCAGIVRAIARGEEPDCHCFGQVHSSPAGWGALARNAVFAAIAGFVVLEGPGPSVTGWFESLSDVELTAAVAGLIIVALLGVQLWLSRTLLRRNGQLLARLDTLEANAGARADDSGEGLAVGTQAPAFDLAGPGDARLSLKALLERSKPLLLVFAHADCDACVELLPELAAGQAEHRERLTVALIGEHGQRTLELPTDMTEVGFQEENAVAREYDLFGSPAAVLVDADGRVKAPAAFGADSVRTLLAEAAPGRAVADVVAADGSGGKPAIVQTNGSGSSEQAGQSEADGRDPGSEGDFGLEEALAWDEDDDDDDELSLEQELAWDEDELTDDDDEEDSGDDDLEDREALDGRDPLADDEDELWAEEELPEDRSTGKTAALAAAGAGALGGALALGDEAIDPEDAEAASRGLRRLRRAARRDRRSLIRNSRRLKRDLRDKDFPHAAISLRRLRRVLLRTRRRVKRVRTRHPAKRYILRYLRLQAAGTTELRRFMGADDEAEAKRRFERLQRLGRRAERALRAAGRRAGAR